MNIINIVHPIKAKNMTMINHAPHHIRQEATPANVTCLCLRTMMAVLVLLGVMLTSSAQAQEESTLSKKIKAGIVYSFLKYTDWSESNNKPDQNQKKSINVCTFGTGSLDDFLFQMHGRTAQQYIINMKPMPALDKQNDCNVLFIHKNKIAESMEVLSFFKRRPVIVMSDIRDFAENGGMVEISNEKEGPINLFINSSAARKAGVNIEPRLLKLAQKVLP